MNMFIYKPLSFTIENNVLENCSVDDHKISNIILQHKTSHFMANQAEVVHTRHFVDWFHGQRDRPRTWGNEIMYRLSIREDLRVDSWFVEGQLCEGCCSTYLCSLRDLHWAVLVSVLCKNVAQAPLLKEKHNSFEVMPYNLVLWKDVW